MGRYYGPDKLRPFMMGLWNSEDWLNGQWSEDDQKAFDFLYDFNVLGYAPFRSNFDDILNEKSWNSYSKRYGLDYSDIMDPRTFHNHFNQSSMASRTFAFVSSNVKRLYG